MGTGALVSSGTSRGRKARCEDELRMDWDHIKLEVSRWHAGIERWDGSDSDDHLCEVAKTCRDLIFRYYKATDGFAKPGSNDQIDALIAAGYCHEAIYSCGRRFEDICDLTSIDVAKLVCAASPDVRMPRAPRMLEFQGRVGASSVFVQLLVAADLQATLREVMRLPGALRLKDAIEYLDNWVADYQGIPDVLCHLRNCEPLARSLLKPLIVGVAQAVELLEALRCRFRAA